MMMKDGNLVGWGGWIRVGAGVGVIKVNYFNNEVVIVFIDVAIMIFIYVQFINFYVNFNDINLYVNVNVNDINLYVNLNLIHNLQIIISFLILISFYA